MGEIDRFWQDRNVFVTGATGFLGPWLVKSLVEKGANVTVLVRDNVPFSNFYSFGLDKKCNSIRGSVEDYQLLLRILNEYEIDTVFHLAAQAIVGLANRSPISTFKTNIEGTWNLLEATRNSPWVKRIIIASTDKAYGDQKELPYVEDAPLLATYPYDVSKACADRLATAYHRTFGLPVVITRCGNLYGGGDLNFNRLIPGTIKSIYHGKEPIIRSDGTYLRDYNYVEDIVDAYLLLAEHIEKGIAGEAFNLSNNAPVSALEIVNVVSRSMGSRLQPKILNEAKGEIKDQFLGAAKANRILGWKPKHSLEMGLKKTIEWYVHFFNQTTAR